MGVVVVEGDGDWWSEKALKVNVCGAGIERDYASLHGVERGWNWPHSLLQSPK